MITVKRSKRKPTPKKAFLGWDNVLLKTFICGDTFVALKLLSDTLLHIDESGNVEIIPKDKLFPDGFNFIGLQLIPITEVKARITFGFESGKKSDPPVISYYDKFNTPGQCLVSRERLDIYINGSDGAWNVGWIDSDGVLSWRETIGFSHRGSSSMNGSLMAAKLAFTI